MRSTSTSAEPMTEGRSALPHSRNPVRIPPPTATTPSPAKLTTKASLGSRLDRRWSDRGCCGAPIHRFRLPVLPQTADGSWPTPAALTASQATPSSSWPAAPGSRSRRQARRQLPGPPELVDQRRRELSPHLRGPDAEGSSRHDLVRENPDAGGVAKRGLTA